MTRPTHAELATAVRISELEEPLIAWLEAHVGDPFWAITLMQLAIVRLSREANPASTDRERMIAYENAFRELLALTDDPS